MLQLLSHGKYSTKPKDNGILIYILTCKQPSKKGSESRQREELLKDDLEMT